MQLPQGSLAYTLMNASSLKLLQLQYSSHINNTVLETKKKYWWQADMQFLHAVQ